LKIDKSGGNFARFLLHEFWNNRYAKSSQIFETFMAAPSDSLSATTLDLFLLMADYGQDFSLYTTLLKSQKVSKTVTHAKAGVYNML